MALFVVYLLVSLLDGLQGFCVMMGMVWVVHCMRLHGVLVIRELAWGRRSIVYPWRRSLLLKIAVLKLASLLASVDSVIRTWLFTTHPARPRPVVGSHGYCINDGNSENQSRNSTRGKGNRVNEKI